MKALAVVAAVCAMSIPDGVAANEQDAWAQCVGMPEDQARLACYDLAAGRQRAPEGAVGRWVVSESVNPVDDSKTVVAVLEATEGLSKYGKPVELYARCQSNLLDVFISWGQYLGDDTSHRANQKDLTMRIGDEKAFPARWGISTDGTATFATSTSKMHFLKGLEQAHSLVVRITPYGSIPVTAIFDITHTAEALRPVMEACGYPPLEAAAPN